MVGQQGLDVAAPLVDSAPVGAGALHVVRHGMKIPQAVGHCGRGHGDQPEAGQQRDEDHANKSTYATEARGNALRCTGRPDVDGSWWLSRGHSRTLGHHRSPAGIENHVRCDITVTPSPRGTGSFVGTPHLSRSSACAFGRSFCFATGATLVRFHRAAGDLCRSAATPRESFDQFDYPADVRRVRS